MNKPYVNIDKLIESEPVMIDQENYLLYSRHYYLFGDTYLTTRPLTLKGAGNLVAAHDELVNLRASIVDEEFAEAALKEIEEKEKKAKEAEAKRRAAAKKKKAAEAKKKEAEAKKKEEPQTEEES